MHRSPVNLQSKHMKPVLSRAQATGLKICAVSRGGDVGRRQSSEQSSNCFPSCPTTGLLFSPLPLCSSSTQCPMFPAARIFPCCLVSGSANPLQHRLNFWIMLGCRYRHTLLELHEKNKSFCEDQPAFPSGGWKPYSGSPEDWDLPEGKAGPGPSLDHPRPH